MDCWLKRKSKRSVEPDLHETRMRTIVSAGINCNEFPMSKNCDQKTRPEDFNVPMTAFVGNVLGAFSRALSDRMDEAVARATGLTNSACYVIIQVGTEPNSSIETLRRMLSLDHSSLVRALTKLENANILERVRGDKNDARVVRIRLTMEGEEVFTKILDARRIVLDRSVENLSKTELNQLQVLINKMAGEVVIGGDDQHFVCRLCELEACPQELCPMNCAHPDHFELPDEPFKRRVDSNDFA